MNKHIFWLSSYPKSGNTLVRAILTGLFYSDDGCVEFNKMENIGLFETTRRLNFIKSINNKDFNNLGNLDILSKYWQNIQTNQELKIKKGFGFLKTHSCLVSINNNFFTSEKITKGYIYVIRDPRDLCVSWSYHSNYSIDQSIEFLCNSSSVLRWINKSKYSEIPKNIFPLQFLSSWDQHVKSWTKNNFQVPKLIIKYEDLVKNKKAIVKKIIEFFDNCYGIKIKNIDIKLENILKTTSFDYMKKMEDKIGFKESMPWSNFFRKGEINQWKTILNKKQQSKIKDSFKEYMDMFSYY